MTSDPARNAPTLLARLREGKRLYELSTLVHDRGGARSGAAQRIAGYLLAPPARRLGITAIHEDFRKEE